MVIVTHRVYPDRGKEIAKTFAAIGATVGQIGFFDSVNAAKAWKNEKGTIVTGQTSTDKHKPIPPRPFFVSGIEENVKNGNTLIQFKDALAKTLGKKDPQSEITEAFKSVSEAGAEGIRKGIDKVLQPRLSSYTLEKRKARGNNSDKPLVDTGEMRQSATYKVVTGKKKKR